MTLAILVVAVNRLTPVAARCDVVGGVGEFDAQGAGREVILRGEVGNWQDLTLPPRGLLVQALGIRLVKLEAWRHRLVLQQVEHDIAVVDDVEDVLPTL